MASSTWKYELGELHMHKVMIRYASPPGRGTDWRHKSSDKHGISPGASVNFMISNQSIIHIKIITYIMVGNTKFTWSCKSQHKSWDTFWWAFWNYLGLTTQVIKGSRWLRGKRIRLQCRRCKRCQRCRFDTWVGKIPWRRKWQPTAVFLLRKCHGRRSLVGYSP